MSPKHKTKSLSYQDQYHDHYDNRHLHPHPRSHPHHHHNHNQHQKSHLHNKAKNQKKFDNKTMTKKLFINRLKYLQLFSTLLICITALLQGAAIATNEWFVLNVNEFIPTSKGGLWYYCYIATSNLKGQFSCSKYEELPNFAIFVNSRLYDSRILLVCSCGFCFILIVIEVFGVLCLCLAETKGDLVGYLLTRRSKKWQTMNSYSQNNDYHKKMASASTKAKLQQHSAKLNGRPILGDEMIDSARFTTSIVVNSLETNNELDHVVKPSGYYAYLAIALITLVGSVMDFVLKVSGFALFDSYIDRLLSFNHVFLTYRSYSYWMMIISIILLLFFWIFKVFSTRHVINLTKKLVYNYEKNTIVNGNTNNMVIKDFIVPSSSFYASSHTQSLPSIQSEPSFEMIPASKSSKYKLIKKS
jgi:hypothetical protein